MNLSSGADFIVGGYTSDDFENGMVVGAYAADWIKANITGKAYLGIMHFDHALPDQSGARWKGFVQALDDAGVDYEIVASQANSQSDPLGTASGMIAAAPNMNVFYANNEGSTIGVAQAVLAEGKFDQIKVFGYDASDQITALLQDETSPLQGVVTQDPYTMGYQAVKLLCEILLNGADYSATAGHTTPVPGELLTKDNLDLVADWRTRNGLK
jgi:simple sugar transport system substrate-binding protein/ribose transport system substrate-binding protein